MFQSTAKNSILHVTFCKKKIEGNMRYFLFAGLKEIIIFMYFFVFYGFLFSKAETELQCLGYETQQQFNILTRATLIQACLYLLKLQVLNLLHLVRR
jgi:hypothetical protein